MAVACRLKSPMEIEHGFPYKFHATGLTLGPLLHLPHAETIVNLDVPQVGTFSLCWPRFKKENVMSDLAVKLIGFVDVITCTCMLEKQWMHA